ncbi:hypothetical protein HanPSC8_Chr02g0070441 [Helianthus annuus]|nr:hypothetical protein HanPSC8_Chr02g0070441 [Helianthus annuus]
MPVVISHPHNKPVGTLLAPCRNARRLTSSFVIFQIHLIFHGVQIQIWNCGPMIVKKASNFK